MQQSGYGSAGRKLLAVFAHPDDEGQIVGTMVKYASQGVEVFLVCATRGEMGTSTDPSLLAGVTMAQLREDELRCACEVLGVKHLRFLNYHEGSFHRAGPSEVVAKLRGIMREFTPQVVITFGPEGVYGHRDHVAVSRWTTSTFYAFRQECLSSRLQLPQKLYYTAYPRSLFDRLRSQGIEFTLDINGAIHKIEGVPDQKITTVIDVSDYESQKVAAFRCHRSQFRPGDLRSMIMQGTLMELLATERLVRVFPSGTGSDKIETEMFE